MAKDFNYVTVDYILNQLSRIPNYQLNEDDIITDISLALGFMVKIVTQEDAVVFLKVENNKAFIPSGYSQINRVSRYNHNYCPSEDEDFLIFMSENNNCEECQEQDYYEHKLKHQGFIGIKYPFFGYTNLDYFKRNFTPVRPTNNLFMNSLVCQDDLTSEVYSSCCVDEYNILKGINKQLVLSFPDGWIAVAIKRPLTDDNTGFPLVPDDSNANEAILAFCKAKIFEQLAYAGREGYYQMSENERAKWGKYLKQFNNAAKMPQTEDDYQSQLETQLSGYPNRNHYYGNMNRIARRKRIK